MLAPYWFMANGNTLVAGVVAAGGASASSTPTPSSKYSSDASGKSSPTNNNTCSSPPSCRLLQAKPAAARAMGMCRTFAVIREVYETGHSADEFSDQLDVALAQGVNLVVVEPCILGENTGRWIAVGNLLHKSGVLMGLAGVLSAPMVQQPALTLPLAFMSSAAVGIYQLCWYCDPCSQYQVEKNVSRLKDTLPFSRLSAATSVVLVRREDRARRWLHNSSAAAALLASAWLFWRPAS